MKQARNGDILCNTCFRLVVALRVSAITTWGADVVLLCVSVLSAMSRLELPVPNWHEALTALRSPMWEYLSSELSAQALKLILPVVVYTAVAQVLYFTNVCA